MSDPVGDKLRAIKWQYADKNPVVLDELRRRVEEVGKRGETIKYTKLVEGITFSYPNVNHGEPFWIEATDWTGLNRKIIGECLGYICMETYFKAGIMASAIVIGKAEGMPSHIFFDWVVELGLVPSNSEANVLKYWIDQVTKTHAWYQRGIKAS